LIDSNDSPLGAQRFKEALPEVTPGWIAVDANDGSAFANTGVENAPFDNDLIGPFDPHHSVPRRINPPPFPVSSGRGVD
jgi:hypothetical protein